MWGYKNIVYYLPFWTQIIQIFLRRGKKAGKGTRVSARGLTYVSGVILFNLESTFVQESKVKETEGKDGG
jgi:hypothetical protein